MSYVGDCNSCGRCCSGFIFIEGKRIETRCENLVVAEPIGRPQATLCAVHGKRTLGMPIRMFLLVGHDKIKLKPRSPGWSTLIADIINKSYYISRCLSTYPRPQDAIPPECSYRWQENKPQPRWSVGYNPSLGNLISEIH